MPRGRHRQSSILVRLLPPLAAGVLGCAAGATVLLSDSVVTVRVVGAIAVVTALAGAVLLRRRVRVDEMALDAAAIGRQRAEERFDEQAAELEYAAEVAEERAARLGRRLAVEKARLARAETANARLLRERAVLAAEQAVKSADTARRRAADQHPGRHPVTPAAFARAAAVLRTMERRAAVAQAQRVAAQVKAESRRRRAAEAARAAAGDAGTGRTAAEAPMPPAEHMPSTPATAIVPPDRQRSRPVVARTANFSFFDRTADAAALAAADAAAHAATNAAANAAETAAAKSPTEDLTDVVGDEAVAEQARYAGKGAAARREAPQQAAVPEPTAAPEPTAVIDLTEHDETERMDVRVLRAVR